MKKMEKNIRTLIATLPRFFKHRRRKNQAKPFLPSSVSPSSPPYDAPDTPAPRHGIGASRIHRHAQGRRRGHRGGRGGPVPVAGAGRRCFGSVGALGAVSQQRFCNRLAAAPAAPRSRHRPEAGRKQDDGCCCCCRCCCDSRAQVRERRERD